MERRWEREWSERWFDFVLDHPDRPWETIEANPEKPWNWYCILQKKDITWKMIQGNVEKPWNRTYMKEITRYIANRFSVFGNRKIDSSFFFYQR